MFLSNDDSISIIAKDAPLIAALRLVSLAKISIPVSKLKPLTLNTTGSILWNFLAVINSWYSESFSSGSRT